LALQSASRPRIGSQFLTEDRQAGFALLWNQRDGRWPQICPNRASPHGVFRFVERNPFQRQLHGVAIPMRIGPLRLLAARLALEQAGVFDAVAQAIADHRVVPINQGREAVVFPHKETLVALLWLLQLKAQSRIVALVLDAGETAPSAFEAHAPGLAQADAVE